MGVVNTTYTFQATDTITSTKMNNIIDDTIFDETAVFGTTLEVASGKLKVRSQNITSNELASNAVITAKIANGSITNDKINAAAAIAPSKLGSGAIPATTTVTTTNIVNASITAAKLNGAQTGTAPIYGCRAWVNFDGSVAGTFAGGVSTVSRTLGSTTATITTVNDHNLTTGNFVQALSGVASNGYAVTVTGSKTFTITTAATTALSSVAITFAFRLIRSSGNVNSVARRATGDYVVNFSTPMTDANYCVCCSAGLDSTSTRTQTALSPYGSLLQATEYAVIGSFQTQSDGDLNRKDMAWLQAVVFS
jgi:hypothetical protein